MSQKKSGIIVQYINILLEFAIAIFFTPFLLKSLGDAEYGLYRIVQSFAGQLSILSFGISTLVARNIVRYNTLEERKKKENFLATAFFTTIILAVVVVIIGFILSLGIDSLFDNSFSSEELVLAKKLYWVLLANVAFTVITDMATGILIAHEKFLIKNSLFSIKQIIRIITLILLLNIGLGSLAIVCTDLLLTILILAFEYFYGFTKLKEKIKFYFIDKEELKESITFSFAIFLQAIVNQVNQNLDSVILGSLTTTEIVAMYSIALNLFTMFNSITMVFGTVFVPQATRMITKGASGEELTDLVVRPGRFAVFIGNLIITGFIIFGKEFISFWVGDKYLEAYTVAIILMIPGILPLMQNVTNAILDAMMKRLGRSLILVGMACINILVSVVLVRRIGYIGAAIGTAVSYIVGYLLLLNIHLKKSTSIIIGKMYSGILHKTVISGSACLVIGYPLSFIKSSNVFIMLIKISIYTVFYFAVIYIFAMNNYERNVIKNMMRRFLPIKGVR